MKLYRLDQLVQNALAFDLETHRIQPGLLAPPMVLGSAAEVANGQLHGQILDKAGVRSLFMQVLDTPTAVICVANGAFDFLVEAVDFAKLGVDIMPKIFAMYDPEGTIVRGDCDGRVFEIQTAEPLHAIAQGHLGKRALTGEFIMNKAGRKGRYSLDAITREVLGREDAKANDRFRESYYLFDDKPISALPFEAVQYPIDDAKNTLENALAIAGHVPSANSHEWVQTGPGSMSCRYCHVVMVPEAPQACMRLQRHRNLHALAPQAYFAWAAHLGSAWGFTIRQSDVDKLEAKVDAAREASIGPFVEKKIIRPNGTEDQSVLKKLVAIAYGARDACPTCYGTGKVPSPKTEGRTKINCEDCDGTCLMLPPTVPRSKGDGVKKDRDTLCESGDELLMEYGEQPSKKIKSTYIPLLRKGRACNVCGSPGVKTKYKPAHEEWCTAPNGENGYREIPLCPRVDPLKETLRAAIEDGLHGIPRKGGVRECIGVPDGFVLSSEDYTAGELMTLAQSCLEVVGWSKLAEALNAKIDVHTALAGTFVGKPYEVMMAAKKAKEKWLDDLRQVGKKSNFGFGGGMAELEFILRPCRADPDLFTPCPGGPTWRDDVQGFNGVRPCILMDHEDYCGRPGEKTVEYNDRACAPVCVRCLAAGKRAREAWFKQWPEMRPFFANVKAKIKDVGPSGTPEIDYPGLITRGNLGFCDGANGYFQMRLAKAAKAAFCQVQRECVDRTWRVRSSTMMKSAYEGLESPLYGSRALALFHDECVCAHPISVASDAAPRVSEIMVEALRFSCPQMYEAIEAKPTLIRRLYKAAEPVYDAGGRLQIWEPKS